MDKIIFLFIVTSLVWGGWPLLARSAGEATAISPLILAFFAFIPLCFSAWWQGGGELPEKFSLLKLFIAGLMMGTGLITYNSIMGSKLVDITVSVPIINTAMLAVTVIGGVLFLKEIMTIQKIVGILFLSIGIFLLRPV